MLFFKNLGIPGPQPSLLWGNMWEICKDGHVTAQKKWHQEFGPVFGYYFGAHPVLLVSDTELLKTILLKEFHHFTDRSHILNPPPGCGFDNALTLLKGQRWKDVRSILTPSFTTKKLKQISPEICSSVDLFMANVDNCFICSQECDMYELAQALTLDTICRAGMGVDFHVQKDVKNSKLLQHVKETVSFPLGFLAMLLFSFPNILHWVFRIMIFVKKNLGEKASDPTTILRKQCAKVVEERRKNPESRRNDLLQLMLDAQSEENSSNDLTIGDKVPNTEKSRQDLPSCPFSKKSRKLTNDEVIDNAFLVLLAGYETTASAMAFLIKFLLRYPEVQEKVREELLEATNQGTGFDFERLQRCQFTEAVMQESLRLYPPVYFFTSRTTGIEKEHGDYLLPEGTSVFSSVMELHYDPQVFEDPFKFKPERFLPENKTPAMIGSWQPFGAGPRNCIGLRFAQMEIKFMLAKLLTKYRIYSEREPLENPDIKFEALPNLLHAKDPVLCRLEEI